MDINNLEIYNGRMAKSLYDKIFFIDNIFEDIDCIIDFGCANGVMINQLKHIYPNAYFIGYDTNTDMIKDLPTDNKTIYISDFKNLKNIMKTDQNIVNSKCKLLNLSSVIHEVYSYGNTKSIREFWDFVFNFGFDYIVIRDMQCSTERPYNKSQMDIIRQSDYNKQLVDFEKVNGKINNQKDFAHFLEMSLGSSFEVETQLLIAKSLGYDKGGIINELLEKIQRIEMF